MRLTLIAFAVAFASLQLNAVAQQSATSSSPDSRTNGSISGRVVNESGQPLPYATVFIRQINSNSTGRATTTDNDGNFQVTGLDSTLYTASAMATTYATPLRAQDTPPIYYRIGDTIRLELIRGGVITGTVTNPTGEPVIGITVRALLVRDENGKPLQGVGFGFGERSTDDRGIYRIYGLVPGTYVVHTTSRALYGGTTPYDLNAPTYSPSSNRDTAAEIAVRSGEESTADIRYRGEQGHVVSGTVKLRGTSGANVSLTPAVDGRFPIGNSYLIPGVRGFAFYGIPDGDYDLVAQEVTATTAMGVDLALSEPRRITVKGTDVTGLELATAPLASISGQFTLESSTIRECQGKRRPSFQESLVLLERNQRDNKDNALLQRMYSSSVSPDKDGKFLVSNIRAGQYAFTPRFFAHYWYIKSLTLGATTPANKPGTRTGKSDASRSDTSRPDPSRNWTTIKGSERLNNLTITLAEGAASIRGRITLAEGEKVPEGLGLYLVPAEREKAEDVLRFFTTAVAADGSFAFANLAPGRYLALVQTMTEKDPETTDKLRLPDVADTRLRIRKAAEAAALTVELKPCQNLTDYTLRMN